ncbi:hypothetical protein HS125_15270 [bacterium]|nr:hypothetical protein [bacterium]
MAPSVFSFAVVVHPRDPKTVGPCRRVKDEQRMAVDGEVVVSRTRLDGGQAGRCCAWTTAGARLRSDLSARLGHQRGGDLLAFRGTTGRCG